MSTKKLKKAFFLLKNRIFTCRRRLSLSKTIATYLNIIFRRLVFGRRWPTTCDGLCGGTATNEPWPPPPRARRQPPAAANGLWRPTNATVPSPDCLGTLRSRHCLAAAAVAHARHHRRSPPKVTIDAPSRRRAHCRWDSGAAAARTRAIAPAPASVMDGLQFDPGGAAIGGVLTTYDPLKKGSIFGASIKKRHTSRFGGGHKSVSDHQINS